MMVDTEEGSSAAMDEMIIGEYDDYFDVESFFGIGGRPDYSSQGLRLDLPSMDHPQGLQTSETAPLIRDVFGGIGSPYPWGNDNASGSTEFSDNFQDAARNSSPDFETVVRTSSHISFSDTNCSGSVSGCLPVPGNGTLYTHANGDASSNSHNDNKKDQVSYHSDAFNYHHDNNVYGSSPELHHLNYTNVLSGHLGGDSSSENLCGEKLTGLTDLGSSLTWAEVSSVMDKQRHSDEARHTDSSSGEIFETYISESLCEDKPFPFFSDDFPCSSELNLSGDGIMNADGYFIENSRSRMCFDHSPNEAAQYNSQRVSDSTVFQKSGLWHPKYIGMDSKQTEANMFKNESSMFRSSAPLENYASAATGLYPVQDFSGRSTLQFPSSIKREISCPNFENKFQTFKQMCTSIVDDDDLCIIEHMSAPACPNAIAINTELASSRYQMTSNFFSQVEVAHSRNRINDERVIFRDAMQDISQPQSEATPPDGVLSVPLLKHQRIALSWMVNKETTSASCSGGILADDQGLGKTVSTIALILKERSRQSKALKISEEAVKTETLNLVDDDDESYDRPHETSCSREENLLSTRRPSAGTLIVCPTSVLKQWYEELHNKVTREADLSVLVYHGNRTKDPLELAQYDVVITTYAIVGMEVPQQPVDGNGDETGNACKEFPSSRKRKLPDNVSDEKSSTSKKKKKEIDSDTSGPLAKVNWFRVVLDEAQSIKNYRTQVARACWGLRAKRRWCLSGTPIQNAIDDLYSYFRFLRHEPYAVFKTFRDQLKVPVHKNPKLGYQKLQAVLKTVMLRRTKATRIDGKPIINLPPKTIELKQVEFSKEERDFYFRLEDDSKAQFAEYAAAGTVKQNYVNILLMLLRLRQACDHPLLVKGFDISSNLTSSVEMAKKLPREKQTSLLYRLEASLAICEICSDPPEDAVVTVCGHVFCNQCICEHISNDDSSCPMKNCKTRLSSSHWFSKTALNISLSDEISMGGDTNNCNDSESALVSNPYSINCPEGSSKIKAAMELLVSLSKPPDCALRTNSSEHIESQKLPNFDSEFSYENTSRVNDDSNNCARTEGQKTIVFSQWTRMLDLLEFCLKKSCIQYRRLDGTMQISSRDRAVKDFNTLPEVSVMIMSLKAASLGLNMVAACNVILLDLWWNPTTEDQAIDRAHRIGQIRPVSVYRLTVKDTVEDRILALQRKKREMVSSAFGEDEAGGRQTRLTVDDLKYLFQG